MTRQEIQKIIIGIILFFSLIFLYVVEFPIINNTIRFSRLLLFGCIGSIIISILIIWFKHHLAKTLFEKFIFSIGTFVILFMLTPLILSLINRISGASQIKNKGFKLLSFSERSEQPFGILDTASLTIDGYRVKVETAHGDASLYVKNRASFSMSKDSIYLPLKRGGLGYYYLCEQ